MIKIKIPEMQDVTVKAFTTVQELLKIIDFPNKYSVVACRVNKVQRSLSWVLSIDSYLEFITTDSIEGIDVYLRTLSFMLTSAAIRKTGLKLHLSQSMNQSFYYKSIEDPITMKQRDLIFNEMQRMVKEKIAIEREEVSVDEARAIMLSQGYYDKERLLFWTGKDPITLYKCEGIYDFFGQAVAISAASTPVFDLHLYEGGLYLSGPTFENFREVIELKVDKKVFAILQDYSKWLNHLSVDSMDLIHNLVARGQSRDFIMLSEALHTKKISSITEEIESRPDIRLICLAGPSSSGKTTISRRLRINLLASCIDSETIELDNYFVDRENTPKDSEGNYDFEALEAINIDLINKHLKALLSGEEISVPRFDFMSGLSQAGHSLKLKHRQLLIIEGIHGLNEKLTEGIPPEKIYRIFAGPLTGTNLDLHNRIGTTDTRLLRRLVRDNNKRGHRPETTLKQWPSVVRGSFRYVFPYQESADIIFNSALAYELSVLKGYVKPLLKSISEDSEAYGEAQRLLSLLQFVPVILPDDVPNFSILREFIGKSCFE